MLRRATLAGLVFAATACTTVRRVQPAGYLAQNSPDVVWVTYDNNVVVPVAEAESSLGIRVVDQQVGV